MAPPTEQTSAADSVRRRSLPAGTAQGSEKVRPAADFRDLGLTEFIIEAAPEREEIKCRIFETLDAVCPTKTILATNTSSISISRIASCTRHPERVIGTHFMNPVPVMNLIEVVRGMRTSDETVHSTYQLAEQLGKTPVKAKDFPPLSEKDPAKIKKRGARMGVFGTAKVKDGKYGIRGDFHMISANMPVRNEDEQWRLMGVTNPRALTHIHMYGGESIFFENLSQRKIFGTRCDAEKCGSCGTVCLPFRIFCPDCLMRNTVVDLTATCRETARIHTFMIWERSGAFNMLDTPIRFINVEFEGVATILMSYMSAGVPSIGMRITPIFRTTDPTYTILDLSWVPAGMSKYSLPEGFSF